MSSRLGDVQGCVVVVAGASGGVVTVVDVTVGVSVLVVPNHFE